MKTFEKKYQVWEATDSSNTLFSLSEYDNLNEAILSSKKLDWYITKIATISIKDSEDVQTPNITPTISKLVPNREIRSDEIDSAAAEAEAKYLRGFTGTVTS